MAVGLSDLLTRRTLLPRNIIIFMVLVLISVRGSSGIEPATFRFVASCFYHYATACPGLILCVWRETNLDEYSDCSGNMAVWTHTSLLLMRSNCAQGRDTVIRMLRVSSDNWWVRIGDPVSCCHTWGEIVPEGVTCVASHLPWRSRLWSNAYTPNGEEALRLLCPPPVTLSSAPRDTNGGAVSYTGNVQDCSASLQCNRG
jgi:hypothetical protein